MALGQDIAMQPASSVLSLTSHTTWDLTRHGCTSLSDHSRAGSSRKMFEEYTAQYMGSEHIPRHPNNQAQECSSRRMYEECARTLFGLSKDADAFRSFIDNVQECSSRKMFENRRESPIAVNRYGKIYQTSRTPSQSRRRTP